jgi:FtsZ-binding cell division protein ZapB
MSEFAWDSKTVDEPEARQPDEPEAEQPKPAAAAETLALSAKEFSALEERILRAVDMVKRERQARMAVEERAAKAEAQLREQAPLAEQLRNEVNALRAERDQVRQRMERLLAQLDALEL